MPQTEQPNANVLTHAYWDGHDIHDEHMFIDAPYTPGLYIDPKELNFARASLEENLGQVAIGNSTEIKYRPGSEFNPELEAGSLVVIDLESLAKWSYDDSERSWESPVSEGGPAITRPYSEYWLNNQDGTLNPEGIGSRSTTFLEEQAIHTRLLYWGVIVAHRKSPVIQPFSFAATKLLPSGRVLAPPSWGRKSILNGQAMAIPVSVGETEVNPRLELERCAIDALERVRSIDVVYLASGGKERKQKPARSLLGRLALPKTHTSHA
jgi:hypothetical protein